MADNSVNKWYVVRAVSGQENKVKSYIEIGFIDKEILEDSNSIEQKLRVIFSMDDFNIELNRHLYQRQVSIKS